MAHGDEYDYTNTQYINMSHKVAVLCPKHGVFEQSPQAHLKGQGCPVCGKEKYKKAMLEKYGVDNPMKLKSIFDKARATSKARYGHEWAQSNPDVRAKVVATNRERYGGDSPSNSVEIQEKIRATTRAHYGVDYISQSPEFQAKRKQTNLKRFGTEEPLSSPDFRDRIAATNRELYGGNAPMCSPEIRMKARQTSYEHYGVAHPGQDDFVKNKIRDSKVQHGTFCTSSGEDLLYDMLCDKFGTNDVRRHYTSDVYPFACDYYIESRSLYIELNASWTHGAHWFSGNEDDVVVLELWQKRGTKYYENAIHVWTEADLKKRETARKNNLNYVVFWDLKLRDAKLWFAMDCPDGHDWKREYSWFPQRQIDEHSTSKLFTGSSSNLSAVVKSYQFETFYAREIELWNQNSVFRTMHLQAWLYANRLSYLGKSPLELTNAELLRGMTIAGVMKGYTVFDTALMDRVVQKYGIKSVYDPCAGWGERMLYCSQHGVFYRGVDVNKALFSGYEAMMCDFNINSAIICLNDSAVYVPDFESEAVITCPPYGSQEIYSPEGAENLDEASFCSWWDKVVENSLRVNPKYFCVQTNQKCRDIFSQSLFDRGWQLIDVHDANIKSGHFTRAGKKNVKREFESMLVFCHC